MLKEKIFVLLIYLISVISSQTIEIEKAKVSIKQNEIVFKVKGLVCSFCAQGLQKSLSGWYWMLPRDSVNVETQYMQRGGHLMMSEIHNTGSRAITDVVVQVHFESANGSEIYETMRIEVDSISAHSSIAGDDLEMLVVGYTVWDEYRITVELEWTDYTGEAQSESWEHEVGYWATEFFYDKADRTIWPFD